jgi:hypothetical protein
MLFAVLEIVMILCMQACQSVNCVPDKQNRIIFGGEISAEEINRADKNMPLYIKQQCNQLV